MCVLPGYKAVNITEGYVVTEKSFGANGEGRIIHKFPVRSDPEEKRRAVEKAFGILYDAAVRENKGL